MAALTAAEIQTVLDAWPSADDDLPATVRAAFDSWNDLLTPTINAAVQALNDNPASEFTTPGRVRGFNKPHKCRTLAVHGVEATAGGPTPSPAELR